LPHFTAAITILVVSISHNRNQLIKKIVRR
jgi:hypothetical protein